MLWTKQGGTQVQKFSKGVERKVDAFVLLVVILQIVKILKLAVRVDQVARENGLPSIDLRHQADGANGVSRCRLDEE